VLLLFLSLISIESARSATLAILLNSDEKTGGFLVAHHARAYW
jgi:hypothetical protein